MADDIDTNDEDALAAEYVLGLLTPQEAAAFEDVLSVDPELRARYAFWAENMAAMTDDIAEVSPPNGVLSALTTSLFGAETERSSPVAEKGRSLLQRLGILPAIGGGLLAALAALFIIDATLSSDPPALVTPLYVAEIAADDDSLVVQASYVEEDRLLILDRTAGGARPDRVLQLWLISGAEAPVSLGVLPDDAQVALQIDDVLEAALDGGILAISDEPPGGSPTGAPTGDVLASGPVTRS